MTQGCLKCLKITMCAANFLCFICGVAVLGFGIYLLVSFKMVDLTPNLANFTITNTLVVSGIIITCLSFLGFMGALKENRCLLLTFFLLLFVLMLLELTTACYLLLNEDKIGDVVKKDLIDGLEKAKGQTGNSTEMTNQWDLVQMKLDCCGVYNASDWGDNIPESCCVGPCSANPSKYKEKGCLVKLKDMFEENFLVLGVSVLIICMVEVLAMCFAMTLFCHIRRSGLGYKL